NAYGWCNQSNQGQGISWSNDLTGFAETGVSGYSVKGTKRSGDTGGSGDDRSGSGIQGSNLNASTTGSINGTLLAFTAPGPAEPLATGATAELRFPVAIPENATVDRGLLFVYMTDAKEAAAGADITPTFRFDGKPVTPAVTRDLQGTGSAPMAGTFTLAIPPEMLAAGDHTLTVQMDAEPGATCRIPAALLVLVAADPGKPRIDYWIADGCDDVLADLWEGTTADDATTEVKFDGAIDRARASAAHLYVVSTAGSGQGGTGNRVALNAWDWLNPLQEGPAGVWTATLDALPFIRASDNTVEVQSYPVGAAGDHLQNRNAILVVRYEAESASPGIEVSSGAGAAPEEEIGSFALAPEEEVRYIAEDGSLVLTFPAGCRATNSTGGAVAEVTVHAVRGLLPPPGMAMERIYRIAPDNTTTGTPFTLAAATPGTARNATWYRYDAAGAAWQPIETTLANGTATVSVKAFGTYG
ncbi:DUF3344 domain-containing protein, partial [Methanoculleus sp.]|uniref:DUF3344 domain-containing protein n=1 Tax=Methanoculleus sp. TaxID=90427 RepID=UPI002BA659BE